MNSTSQSQDTAFKVFAVVLALFAGAVWPWPSLVTGPLAFAFVFKLRKRLPPEYFNRTNWLVASMIVGALGNIGLSWRREASHLADLRRAAAAFVEAPTGDTRIARLAELTRAVNSAANAGVDSKKLAPYRPPQSLKELRATLTADPCPIPPPPIPPHRSVAPSQSKATIAISGRVVRSTSNTSTSAKEILIQDGDQYFIVKEVDTAWFLPQGPNYAHLTGETRPLDIADGRTAKVALVSDYKGFLDAQRKIERAQADRVRAYDAALAKYDSLSLARKAAIDARPACQTRAALLEADFKRQLYLVADDFARHLGSR